MTTQEVQKTEAPCACMKDWIEEEGKKEECRWCALAVLIGEYQTELEREGHYDLALSLADAMEDEDDPFLKIAETMDSIKESVPPAIKDRLQSLDCEAQEFNLEEVKQWLED